MRPNLRLGSEIGRFERRTGKPPGRRRGLVLRRPGRGTLIEPLERRLMLTTAGLAITSAQPSSWNVYAGTTIACDFGFRWWQGTVGGGTTKTLVVGIHDLAGHWVSGTAPYALMQDNPSISPPGDGWSMSFSGLDVPATLGNYVVVAAEEPAATDAAAEADFTLGKEIAYATIGQLTTTSCSPGMTISDVSQTSWTTTTSAAIGGSFTAHVWNGTAAPDQAKAVVVGIRDATGHWAAGTEPLVLNNIVPPIGSPGADYPLVFSGLSVPTQTGQYQVVAAEEPYTDAILAFEASADLATVQLGTLTATQSTTVYGPLLPFQTWDQSGHIAWGSGVNFNDYCPIDPATGIRSITGCVATAMAELAYYWRSLTSLSFGAADAYTSSAGTGSQVQIDADAAAYGFPNFSTLNTGLAQINYDYNPSQMALLAFGLGVKAQADYTTDGTAAAITASWLRTLGYPSAASSTNWNTIKPTVIANLKARAPVIVEFPGHMALIDGYDQSSGQFHVVLGWGGSDDGWYTLPDANVFPGTQTTGLIDGIDYNLRPATPLAASLVVNAQPTTVNANAGFAVSVILKDITGATAIGDHSAVTLSILTGPAGGVLSGNTSVAAVNGTASFSGLSLSQPGGYVLALSDAGDSLSGFFTGTITVNQSVTLSPDTLLGGTYNAPYDQTMTGASGTDSVTLAVSNIQNAIPGLILPAGGTNTLHITGTPAATGTETFTVTATNSDGGTKIAAYSITIDPAALSVTTDPAGKTYGQVNPTFTGTLGGMAAGDGITVSYSTTATQFSHPGGYPITATLIDPNNKLGNYTVTNDGGTLTIGKADPLITWATPAAITYGTPLSATQLNAAASGVPDGSSPGAPIYGPLAGAVLSAGNQTLTCTVTATADYNQGSGTVTLAVNPATLTVTPDPKTKAYGQVNPTLTGTIAGMAAGDAITATYATAAAPFDHPGDYPITATLNDPNNKLGNYTVTNNGSTLTITKADQTILWATPAPITHGAALTATQLNATVSGAPGGSAAGALTYDPLAGAVPPTGSQTLTATAAATTDYNPAAKSVTLVVNPRPPHLDIVQQPLTTAIGLPLAPGINVALEDESNNILAKPTGKVSVTILTGPAGGTLKGTTTAGFTNTVAVFNNLSFTAAGDYTLQFTDSLVTGSAPVTLSLTIAQGVTTIPLPKVAAAGYTYGKAILLSTTFKSTAPGSVPFLGTASLVRDDGTVLATAPLSTKGAAKFTFTAYPAAYVCTIRYAGDANHAAAESAPFTCLSNKAPTTTTLKTSVSSLFFGLPVTLTATVASAYAPATPRTGTITFMDGLTVVGTAPLDGASTATLPISTPTIAPHSYTAVYSGDGIFKTGNSAAKKVTVKKDTVKAALVPAAIGTLVPGQPLTLTAGVVLTAGANTPAGIVTFKDGSKILGAAPLDATGLAALPTAFATAGTHAVTASYGGDPLTTAASSAALKFTVAKAPTQVAFSSPDSTIPAGTSSTFTIQVTALAPAALTPSGKVAIKEGTKTLATLTLAAGQALWITPLTLAPGPHIFTASYVGDANDLAGVSLPAFLTVA